MAVQTSILYTKGPKEDLAAVHNIYFALVKHFSSLDPNVPDDADTVSLRESLSNAERILGLGGATPSTAQQVQADSSAHFSVSLYLSSLGSLYSTRMLNPKPTITTRLTFGFPPPQFTVPDPQHTAQRALDGQYSIDYHTAHAGASFNNPSLNENFYSPTTEASSSVPSYQQSAEGYSTDGNAYQAQVDNSYMYGGTYPAAGYSSNEYTTHH
ncbi:hypothetical protein BJ508DRAFT_327529 [Ascobolus immersus RN42]|uniref:Uncharacterized protein n=1 Tax=Ascobolus immersus RN42 TaxID=1160509 RepID=A0A3N4I4A0_ASCIM|nr:hypothetical protein BJ508DRAFT_327529 [Ascobolus immersus RN42]